MVGGKLMEDNEIAHQIAEASNRFDSVVEVIELPRTGDSRKFLIKGTPK